MLREDKAFRLGPFFFVIVVVIALRQAKFFVDANASLMTQQSDV